MPDFLITEHTCTRCGKKFEAPGKPVPGMNMYCRKCTKVVIEVNRLEQRLIADDFKLEREDEQLARQINDLLGKESAGISENDEELLTALIERMLSDESRRRKILRRIRRLQRDKH